MPGVTGMVSGVAPRTRPSIFTGRLVGGLAADQVGGHVQDRLRLGRVRRAGDGVRLLPRRQRRLAELGAAEIDLAAHALGEARLRLELEVLLVHRQRVVAAVERAIGEAEVAVGAGQLGIGGDGRLERLDGAVVVAARVALVALGEALLRLGVGRRGRFVLLFVLAAGGVAIAGGEERGSSVAAKPSFRTK